jgi:integrase
VAAAHKAKGFPSPVESPVLSSILAKARKASARRGWRVTKKTAVVKDHLDRMLETCSSGTLVDVRDRALLLFAWASGGRRRSEVVDAVVERLEPVGAEFVYTLGVTKTDQEGAGVPVPVAGRAAEAMREWLEASGVKDGPIFRGLNRHGGVSADGLCDKTVARIVKRRAQMVGLDPARFAGHSLRSGFMTEAGSQGKNLFEAMTLSTHKTVQVAAGYHQAGAGLRNEAARLLG